MDHADWLTVELDAGLTLRITGRCHRITTIGTCQRSCIRAGAVDGQLFQVWGQLRKDKGQG